MFYFSMKKETFISRPSPINNSYQLLNNLLNEFTERIRGMLYPKMVDQFGNNFSIGITFEHVSSLLQQSFNFLVVRHDTCIQDDGM